MWGPKSKRIRPDLHVESDNGSSDDEPPHARAGNLREMFFEDRLETAASTDSSSFFPQQNPYKVDTIQNYTIEPTLYMWMMNGTLQRMKKVSI